MPGSLNSSTPFLAGLSPVAGAGPWLGWIDEVDLDGDGEFELLISRELVNAAPDTEATLTFSSDVRNGLTFEWPEADWKLRSADFADGPWSDVPGAKSPFVDKSMLSPAKYYRLIQR